MSWVMVVTPSQYFLPRLTKPNKNEAPSSDCMSHQASSTTKIRFLMLLRTRFHTYRVIINKAIGFKDSSMSFMPKTTKFFWMLMFDRWLKKEEKVPAVNFLSRRTSDSDPVMLSSTSTKSDIMGIFCCQVVGSDSGVMSRTE